MKSLETGEEIAINADRQMETMSTIKIPLMIEVFEQIKAGKFTLTDKYTFADADSRGGTGIDPAASTPGAVLTVKDLITLMIIVSDNTATDVLYRMVGGPDGGERADGRARPEDDARADVRGAMVRGAARGTVDRSVLPRRQASRSA